ncbi:MAG: hypothetical protein KAW46_06875, partial [candidate division Zixibacteria bacterium]|nr:hypothetical protein [candidate division Zixibacteria bacterium]
VTQQSCQTHREIAIFFACGCAAMRCDSNAKTRDAGKSAQTGTKTVERRTMAQKRRNRAK